MEELNNTYNRCPDIPVKPPKKRTRKGQTAAIVILSVLAAASLITNILLVYRHRSSAVSTAAHSYTSEQFSEAVDSAKNAARDELLSDMQTRLSGGTGINTLLREYFPDKIVYTDNNRYVFADIHSELKQNKLKGTYTAADSGEITYTENGQILSHKGIDISRYQGNVDFSKVYDDGVEYVMMRCGYRSYGSGVLMEDTSFRNNVTNALQNNLSVGVYFFTQAISVEEAIEEADFVLNLIRPYNITYPIALDVEEIAGDTYRQQDLTPTELTDIIIAFCERIRASGYTPMIYGNLKCFAGMVDITRLEAYEKWFAYYSDEPYLPYEFSMWQYTSSGTVAGVSGNVDMNISFKTW